MPQRKVFKESEEKDESDSLPGSDSSDVDEHQSDDMEAGFDNVDDDGNVGSEGDDDNDEPEAVSFATSKVNVLDRVRTALHDIERDRNELREKRRKRDLLFKEQKRQKLERLEQCRLPDDILEAAAVKSSANSIKSTGQKISASHVAVNKLLPSATADAVDPVAAGDGVENDFIPLESGGGDAVIKAMTAKQMAQKASRAQTAIHFRQKQLYGKQVRRESGSSLLARREKKAARRR